jgi:hypothetical protein
MMKEMPKAQPGRPTEIGISDIPIIPTLIGATVNGATAPVR